MKKYLLKTGFALICSSILVLGVYCVLHAMSQKSNNYIKRNGKVFVWGDSQMWVGLDVPLLTDRLGKQSLTSATAGAGVYDFLLSEKNIPSNSVCIVSFPEAALLREPLRDNNRTGFELSCLETMFRVGCPMDECLRIMNLNSGNINYIAFNKSHKLIPYSESIVYDEPLSRLCRMFSEEKDYFVWKAKVYYQGIRQLSEKQSQIVLVQFPFEKQVEECARGSINRHLTDSLKSILVKDFAMKYEMVVLDSDSLLMYDLAHMNEVGARLATIEIANILQSDTVNNHFIEVSIR